MTVPNVTNGNVSSSSSNIADTASMGQFSAWFWAICMPITFVLGVFGNTMTITILRRFKVNHSTLDRYFLCVAVTDLCVNFTGPLRWWIMTVTEFHPFAVHDAACKLGFFVLSMASTCSAWFVVAMVTHRAMSVVWPHRVNVMCTAKTTWTIIAVIVILFTVTSVHLLYGMQVSGGFCGPKEDYRKFLTEIYLKFDIFLSSLLPFSCLMISNIVLVINLRTSVKEANDQFAATEKQQSDRERKVNSITLTALAVSVSFIVFTLPNAVKNMVDFTFLGTDDIHNKAFSYFLQRLLICFLYLNFSMNFYLYCLTGQRFRREFMEFMKGLCFCCKSSPK